MKDREFDESIKTRLKDYESFVPDNMWERITGKKKQRKAGFFLWRIMGAAGFLLLCGSAIYYFIHPNNKNSQELSINVNRVSDTATFNDRKDINHNQNSKAGVSQNFEDVSKYTDNSLNKKDAVSKSIKITKKQTNKSRIKAKGQAMKNKDGDIVRANQATKNISNSTSGGTKNADSSTQTIVKENLPSKTDSSGKEEATAINDPVNEKYSIEVYVSPDMPVSGISAGNKAYEKNLRDAGSMRLSYTIGLRFCYAISKRISAKIGLQYSRINEKVLFTDAQGNNYSSANRYKTISVPLLLSYKMNDNNSLSVSINAGMLLNIVSHYNGIIPSINNQPIDLKNNPVYNRNVNASLYFGADISKRISRRSDIFAEPGFSYRTKNMVSHYYSFNQRIHSPGLSVGLRYRLYKDRPPQF